MVQPWGVRRIVNRVSIVPLATVLLLATGCGSTKASGSQTKSSPSATSSIAASASPTSTAPANLLFAVLETHKSASQYGPDTVAIAGLDGYARAKATFQPLTIPYLGCVGPILPTQAYVASGKVFYIDGMGVVRSITTTGTVSTVARFPVSSGQEASFAVSPDGTHLLGAVLTFPSKPSSAQPCSAGVGNFEEEVYSAVAGSSAVRMSGQVWTQNPRFTEFIGWDITGPIGTYPSAYGTQGGPAIRWSGPVVRVDLSGKPGQSLGSAGCTVSDVAVDGNFVCVSEGGLRVIKPDGTELWHATIAKDCCLYGLLAPDEQHAAVLGPAAMSGPNRPDILGRDGSDVAVTQPFMQMGWLDSDLLIGISMPQLPDGHIAVADRLHPATIDDLGFKASFFVGVL